MKHTPRFLDLCDRLISRGHGLRFRAEGWSMYPAIQDGDTIEAIGIVAMEIRRGDVLLCRLGSGLVAHRVVRILRTSETIQVVLRGDAAFANDLPVDASEILGKVIAVTRDGSTERLDTLFARITGVLLAHAWRAKRQARFARITQTSARSSHSCPW